MTTWSNWSGSVTSRPVRVEHPTSTEEVVDLIRRAREEGLRVKAVGSGHSFSPIAHAPGVLVRMEGMAGLLAVDAERRRVRLGAGTPLHAVPGLLAPHGLAMANLGDVDRQTISGAISTGTHGTGLAFGGIATQVVGLTLVDGTGEVHTFGEEDRELKGAVVGLGALGVVTEVELQCVESFVLALVEKPMPMVEALDGFVERCHQVDHAEIFWFPHTGVALTKTTTRLPGDAPLAPLSRRQRLVDDELLGNGVYALTCRAGARVPALIPHINRLATRLTGDRQHTDLSHKVLVASRGVRFHETEWSVPLEALPEVVRAIGARIEAERWRVSFPLEIRATAADDLWTSTAQGRPSGYVAAHTYRGDTRVKGAYFAAVQEICLAHEGRPHWGKEHRAGAETLAAAYPQMGDFRALRDRLDPDRVLGNAYLSHVLGD